MVGVADPSPRLIKGWHARLQAEHSSHPAQMANLPALEVKQPLTILHQKLSSNFVNYKGISYFLVYVCLTSAIASKLKDLEVNSSILLQTQLCHSCVSHLGTQRPALLFWFAWNHKTENWQRYIPKAKNICQFSLSVKNLGLKGGKKMNSIIVQQQEFLSFPFRKSWKISDMNHLLGRKGWAITITFAQGLHQEDFILMESACSWHASLFPAPYFQPFPDHTHFLCKVWALVE